ncbi:MAG: rRNA methyltransferase, partial [Actinomycetia bacterium]|nr:rRNA methyltransferase [Actinomycetes bacterium]
MSDDPGRAAAAAAAAAADPTEATGAARAVRRWNDAGPDAVLLDGFHALKHALRFGADVRVALCADKAGTLRLAADLAPDLVEQLTERLTEVPAGVLRDLMARVHPTAVAALAARPSREAHLAALSARPRRAPVVVLDNPRNLG